MYQNDTKYKSLHDQDRFSYWTLEITSTFVPFIALIVITRQFLNMDIHVSEQGHTDKCTWRNRVFCCWWILFKRQIYLFLMPIVLEDIPFYKTNHSIVTWRCLLRGLPFHSQGGPEFFRKEKLYSDFPRKKKLVLWYSKKKIAPS